MSTLVVLIPPRPRLAVPGAAASDASALSVGTNFEYVLSADDLSVSRHGHATRDLLPRAETVVAVLAETEVSWHSITVPKAPASRLGAALAGTLEEALLEDAERVHLALPPLWQAGESAWVAATHLEWLASALRVLEPRLHVDRIVPSAVPGDPPRGHFHSVNAASDDGDAYRLCLTWSTSRGVTTWPLQGGLARSLLPSPLPPSVQFTATPSAAAPAERWLNGPVRVVSPAERLLQASHSSWNLRQFGLQPRHRGLAALSDQGRRLMGPRWRPARLGLAGLVAVQLLGLNLWAWQQKRTVEERRDAMVQLLRDTHPQVRTVLDAPAQMARETETLRAAAGEIGQGDFETLLSTAASAWPADRPVQTLQFEPGRLTLAVPGWTPAQLDQFRNTLVPSGWKVETQDGRATLSPGLGGRS